MMHKRNLQMFQKANDATWSHVSLLLSIKRRQRVFDENLHHTRVEWVGKIKIIVWEKRKWFSP
jgi:hypothetical protein